MFAPTIGDARAVGELLEHLEGVPLKEVRVGFAEAARVVHVAVSTARPQAFYAVVHSLGLEVWPVRRLTDCVSFFASGTVETLTVSVDCFLRDQDGAVASC